MKIKKHQLEQAVSQEIITAQQADELYQFLEKGLENTPQFNFTHVLYYLGGLIAIGAMTLFMNLGWEKFGGAGIFFIALLYAAIGLKITHSFVAKNLHIPAGICVTFVVCLTPLAIYGLQQWLGVWPEKQVYQGYHRYIEWHWLYIELGTLAVGAAMAWWYRYPFMLLPVAVTLWYLSMDLVVMINGGEYAWELRQLVSLYFGLLMIGLAFWIDIRSRHSADFAFWIYIFGVITFWGGLTSMDSNSELSKFLYFCINLVMIGVGVVLIRRVFVIFGALGVCIYLSHLASDIFKDSWLFPISLTLIGLGIIYLGVIWQKHEKWITEKSRNMLPNAFRELLEAKQ